MTLTNSDSAVAGIETLYFCLRKLLFEQAQLSRHQVLYAQSVHVLQRKFILNKLLQLAVTKGL